MTQNVENHLDLGGSAATLCSSALGRVAQWLPSWKWLGVLKGKVTRQVPLPCWARSHHCPPRFLLHWRVRAPGWEVNGNLEGAGGGKLLLCFLSPPLCCRGPRASSRRQARARAHTFKFPLTVLGQSLIALAKGHFKIYTMKSRCSTIVRISYRVQMEPMGLISRLWSTFPWSSSNSQDPSCSYGCIGQSDVVPLSQLCP